MFYSYDEKFHNTAQGLVDDYIKFAGMPSVYMPKEVRGKDEILNEEIQIAYPWGFVINVAFTDVPVMVDSPVIDKFGLDYLPGNFYTAEISKRELSEQMAVEGLITPEPSIGDLFYVKPAKIFMEVMNVFPEPNIFSGPGRTYTFKMQLAPWENNMDIFPTELIEAFDTMEGMNDLVLWRRQHDLMGIRFPDQNGDRSCMDELNQPVDDGSGSVDVDPATYESDYEDFADSFTKEQEKKDGYAKNKALRDAKDFGWS